MNILKITMNLELTERKYQRLLKELSIEIKEILI